VIGISLRVPAAISLRVPAAISLRVPAAISLCVPMGDHIDRPVTGAVETVRGEWQEALERRKMAPAELVLFALGPVGIVAAFAMHSPEEIGEAAGAVADAVASVPREAPGLTRT